MGNFRRERERECVRERERERMCERKRERERERLLNSQSRITKKDDRK